jgi:hypothetical protein
MICIAICAFLHSSWQRSLHVAACYRWLLCTYRDIDRTRLVHLGLPVTPLGKKPQWKDHVNVDARLVSPTEK